MPLLTSHWHNGTWLLYSQNGLLFGWFLVLECFFCSQNGLFIWQTLWPFHLPRFPSMTFGLGLWPEADLVPRISLHEIGYSLISGKKKNNTQTNGVGNSRPAVDWLNVSWGGKQPPLGIQWSAVLKPYFTLYKSLRLRTRPEDHLARSEAQAAGYEAHASRSEAQADRSVDQAARSVDQPDRTNGWKVSAFYKKMSWKHRDIETTLYPLDES